ncbi:MAG TPA: recombinase family protein, partial [Pedobacter sp.]
MSSVEQVGGTSLDMQKRECTSYAEREDIEILGYYIEEGESAKTANRTEFQKALAYCSDKNNRVDFFIVHKVDRFARSQEDHVVTRAFLKKNGVALRSVTEHIDETHLGKLMEGVLSSVAEFDNSVRAARSKSGMIERVKQGVWIWPAPLGYTRLIRGGNLTVDDEVAPYIRLAFEEWAKGTHSFKSLAKFLGERGMRTRTGKMPFAQLLEKILRNPVYVGIIRPQTWGFEVKGNFPPLIDEDLFTKCQSEARTSGKSAPRIKESPYFSLRQFVICPECKTPLTASFSTGRHGGKYAYYHHQKKGCPAASYIPAETFEQNFMEFLQDVSPKLRSEKMFREVVLDVWKSNY